MKVLNPRDALASVPELVASASTSVQEAMDAVVLLGDFNHTAIGLTRFRGHTPWERHPEDELLYVLEGSVAVEVLPEFGPPKHVELRVGEMLCVPSRLWHRQRSSGGVALLFLTSRDGNEVSTADDPRTE